MSFFEFIKKILNINNDKEFGKCLKYVADKCNVTLKSNRQLFSPNDKETEEKNDYIRTILAASLLQKRRKNGSEKKEELFPSKLTDYASDEKILDYFDKDVFYRGWIDEGISIDSMEKYGIEWYENQKYIIIPHRDINGKLVGIRRRSLKPEDADNKYMPLFMGEKSFHHDLGLNLYGAYENKEAIRTCGTAIIVEGEKSVLLSDTYYGRQSIAVATCGFTVSNAQMQILKDLGVRTVYLAFDKDFDLTKPLQYEAEDEQNGNQRKKDFERYKQRLNSLQNKLKEWFCVYTVIDRKGLLKIKDSPFDRGREALEILLKDARNR